MGRLSRCSLLAACSLSPPHAISSFPVGPVRIIHGKLAPAWFPKHKGTIIVRYSLLEDHTRHRWCPPDRCLCVTGTADVGAELRRSLLDAGRGVHHRLRRLALVLVVHRDDVRRAHRLHVRGMLLFRRVFVPTPSLRHLLPHATP